MGRAVGYFHFAFPFSHWVDGGSIRALLLGSDPGYGGAQSQLQNLGLLMYTMLQSFSNPCVTDWKSQCQTRLWQLLTQSGGFLRLGRPQVFFYLLSKYCETNEGQEGHRGISNFSHQYVLFQTQSISLIIKVLEKALPCFQWLSNQLGFFFFLRGESISI